MKNRFALPLALFLSYWLVQGQALALGPGVPWERQGAESVVGTYTGVGVPRPSDEIDAENFFTGNNAALDPEGFVGANSLFVFSVGVEEAGFSEGSIVIFVNGGSFDGDITVFGNAESQQLVGVIDAQANFIQEALVPTGVDDNGNPVFEEIDSQPLASGQIVCDVVNVRSGVKQIFQSFSAKLLKGTAQITIVGDIHDTLPDEVSYDVQGVKQSGDVVTSTIDLGNTIF